MCTQTNRNTYFSIHELLCSCASPLPPPPPTPVQSVNLLYGIKHDIVEDLADLIEAIWILILFIYFVLYMWAVSILLSSCKDIDSSSVFVVVVFLLLIASPLCLFQLCPLSFATRMQAGKLLIEVGEYEVSLLLQGMLIQVQQRSTILNWVLCIILKISDGEKINNNNFAVGRYNCLLSWLHWRFLIFKCKL